MIAKVRCALAGMLALCAIACVWFAAGCDQSSQPTTLTPSPSRSSQANAAAVQADRDFAREDVDASLDDDDATPAPADVIEGNRRIRQTPGKGIRSQNHLDIAYGPVLRAVVTDDGRVRSERLQDREMHDRLHAATDQYRFMGLPDDRTARLAFLINAFNANVLEMTALEAGRSGFTSVGAIDGFFDRPIAVGRATTTLNRLLREEILPIADARVHAALVRGSRSCPPLRRAIYYADDLDEHLDEQCRLWVNMPVTAQVKDGTIVLCETFRTHGEHFRGSAASIDDGIRAFLRRYAAVDSPLARALAGSAAPPLAYSAYDWTPTETPRIATPADAAPSESTTSNIEIISQ